ncbi:MaoC family dehydratase N-terminal domain-containing protein [Paenibacillus azoreducens]|uniref:FAS1-like dehydratase domain-containing protein n=1 Tax=Paenibacillus azoreducens TaxID=116718 RepID=UPI0039F6168A
MNKLQQRIHIRADSILQYAKSIGAPVQMLDGVLIAPATMPIIFWQASDIPWLPANGTLIHGSQHFSYEAPVVAGMTLDCELSLTRVEQKTGRKGQLILYTQTLICKCCGDLIVTAETVLISVGDEA